MSLQTAKPEARRLKQEYLPNRTSEKPESQGYYGAVPRRRPVSLPEFGNPDFLSHPVPPSDVKQLDRSAVMREFPKNIIDEPPQGTLHPTTRPSQNHTPESLQSPSAQGPTSIHNNTSSAAADKSTTHHMQEPELSHGTISSTLAGKPEKMGDAEGATRFTKTLRRIRKMIDEVLLRRTELQHEHQLLESCRQYLHESTTALKAAMDLSEGGSKGEGSTKQIAEGSMKQTAGWTSHRSAPLPSPIFDLLVFAQDQEAMPDPQSSESENVLPDRAKLYDEYNKDYQALCQQETAMKKLVNELSNLEYHLGEKQAIVQKAMHARNFATELKDELLDENLTISETNSQKSSTNDTPPLVSEYFSRRGEVGIIQERISDLRYNHQEGLEAREFMAERDEGPLEVSDEEFERNFRFRLEQLEEELKQAQAEAEDLARECSVAGYNVNAYRGIRHSERAESAVQMSPSSYNAAEISQVVEVSKKTSLKPQRPSTKQIIDNWVRDIPSVSNDQGKVQSVISGFSSPSSPYSVEPQVEQEEVEEFRRPAEGSNPTRPIPAIPGSHTALPSGPRADSKHVVTMSQSSDTPEWIFDPRRKLYYCYDARSGAYFYEIEEKVSSNSPHPRHSSQTTVPPDSPNSSSWYALRGRPPQQTHDSPNPSAHAFSESRLQNEERDAQPVRRRVWKERSGRRIVDAVDPASQVRLTVATGPLALITDPDLLDDGISARRHLMGTEGETELLFDGFRKRKQPKQFFVVGKVFSVLWVESRGEGSTIVTSLEEGMGFGRPAEKVFSKVRRFVVIREAETYCSALPITTYGGRGVSKAGVKKSEHSIIYTGETPPKPLSSERPQRGGELGGELGMRSDAIRVKPDDRRDRLTEVSRIDYGKVHTIQHNVKVKAYGQVHPSSRNDLQRQFRSVWEDMPAPRIPKSADRGASYGKVRSGAAPPVQRDVRSSSRQEPDFARLVAKADTQDRFVEGGSAEQDPQSADAVLAAQPRRAVDRLITEGYPAQVAAQMVKDCVQELKSPAEVRVAPFGEVEGEDATRPTVNGHQSAGREPSRSQPLNRFTHKSQASVSSLPFTANPPPFAGKTQQRVSGST